MNNHLTNEFLTLILNQLMLPKCLKDPHFQSNPILYHPLENNSKLCETQNILQNTVETVKGILPSPSMETFQVRKEGICFLPVHCRIFVEKLCHDSRAYKVNYNTDIAKQISSVDDTDQSSSL